MGRQGSRNQNNLIQVKTLLYLQCRSKMADMNRIKSPAE
jgi:hypothetical protein